MKKALLNLFSLCTLCAFNVSGQSFTWARNWGGFGQINTSYGIAVDANGTSYTTGYFSGTGDFDPGTGTYTLSATGSGNDDIFISKFDNAGNFVWAKQIGGTALDHALCITLDSKKNILITGTFQGTVDFDPGAGTYTLTSAGGDDDFICKLDSNGNFRWACRLGNANVDGASGIAVDPSDNVLVTGFFRQTVDFDPGSGTSNLTVSAFEDIYVLKLDSAGLYVWARRLGGLSDDYGYAITTDAAGNVYTTGTYGYIMDMDPGAGTYTVQAVGGSDIFVSKLDASGNYVWGGSMGGSNIDAGNAIKVDASGNTYLTGYIYGSGDMDPGIGTYSVTAIGDKDIFVEKLDANGNMIWVELMGGTNIDVASGLAIDGGGNVYTAGFFHSASADFDPGAGTDLHTPVWGADIFISCLDVNGNYVSSRIIGGANGDGASGIALDGNNTIYTTGNFGGVVDFDPGAGTVNLTSSGASDVFLLKLGSAPVGIRKNDSFFAAVNLFPNPFQDRITLSLSGPMVNYHIKLLNSAGQVVMEESNIRVNNYTIDLSAQTKGVYFLEITDGTHTSHARLIKAE